MLDSDNGAHESALLADEVLRERNSSTASRTSDGNESITIPDAHLLFHAEFKRAGSDLKLIDTDGKVHVVSGYFKSEHLATLLAPDGASLSGDIVAALAGPLVTGKFAAADVPHSGMSAIGRAAKVEGNVTVVRNGVAVVLNNGDAVLKGDVVQTGSDGIAGLVFNDGSAFQITHDSRLVLSEFSYDPHSADNSEIFNLVQGSFSFISGNIAKIGNMRIGTPVAATKITGTAGGGDISSDNGQVTLYIFHQNDGLHQASVLDQDGNVVAILSSEGGKLILTPSGVSQFITGEQPKTDADKAAELSALNAILQIKGFADQLVTASSGIHGSSYTPPGLNDQGLGLHNDVGTANGVVTPLTIVIPQQLQNFDSASSLGNTQPSPHQDQAPTSVADSYSVDEDGILVVAPRGVLVNDSDPENDILQAVLDQGPQHGTLTVNADGSFVYSPVSNYNGIDSFTYHANDGILNSTPVTVTITVNSVNDAPVLTSNAASVAAVEQTPIVVAAGLTLSDIDSTTLLKATVAITGNYQAGEDSLSFADTALIHGVFDSATGTLTLTAQAGQTPLLADFEAALHTVTYADTSDTPSTLARTLTITVQDPDGTVHNGQDTSFATVTLSVTPVNDAPVLVLNEISAVALERIATAVAPSLSLSDVDSNTLDHAAVQITGNYLPGEDVLSFTNTALIQGVFDSTTGTLTLIAQAGQSPTVADFEAALQAITYTDTSNNPSPLERTLSVTVQDPDGTANGGANTAVQTITLTVTPVNSPPIITGESNPASVAEIANASAQLVGPISGTLSASDLDIGDTLTGSVVNNALATYSGGALPGSVDINALLASGAISFNSIPTSGAGNTLTWTYNPAATALDWLAVGETLTITYTAQVTDGSATIGSQPLTITILGRNDATAIISAPSSGSVTEDVTVNASNQLHTTGTISFTDLDLSDSHTASAPLFVSSTYAGGQLGFMNRQITIDTTGTGLGGEATWRYFVDDSLVQFLAAGESITETYAYTIRDGNGGTSTQNVEVTIIGKNDAPIVTAAITSGGVNESGSLNAQGQLLATGSVNFTDVDISDTHSSSVAFVGSTYAGGQLGMLNRNVIIDTTGTGTGGVLNWRYIVDPNAVQFLQQGQVVTETYTLTLKDGHGGQVAETINITITGTNDVPVLSTLVLPSPVPELADASHQDISITGVLQVSDADVGDTLTALIVGSPTVTLGGNPFTLPAGAQSLIANALTFDTGVLSNGGAQTINWTYDPSAADLDFLPAGKDLVLIFNVKVNDGTTDSSTQQLTITITGANDAPVATAVTATGGEDAASIAVTLSAADPDVGDTVSLMVTSLPDHGTLYTDATLATAIAAGMLISSGAPLYFVPDADFSGTVTFQYSATDSSNAVINATATIDVAPVADPLTFTSGGGSGPEDTNIVIGKFSPSDTDGSEHITKLVLSGFVAGAIFKINGVQAGALQVGGVDDGKWVITDHTQLDALSTTDLKMTPPQDYNGTFTLDSVATVTDTATLTTGQTSVSQTFNNSVSVNVTPVDDAPVVIASAQDHDLVETGTNVTGVLTASRTLTLSDADVGDISGTFALGANGWTDAGNGNWTQAVTYGTVTLSTSTNTLTYTLDDGLADKLHAGQTVTDGVPVPTTDAGGAQGLTIISFTIDGSNDAPTLSAIVSPATIAAANSNGQDLASVTGTLSVTDVDVGDTFAASVVGTPTAMLGGNPYTLSSDAMALITNALTFGTGVHSNGGAQTIDWTYDPGAANLSFLNFGDTLTLTFNVKVNDGAVDSGTQTLTITLGSQNHAPVIGSNVGFGLISDSTAGTVGDQDSGANPFQPPSVTPDGKEVVFDSYANNFAAGDSNNDSDVFVKDTETGVTALVSSDASGNKLVQTTPSSLWIQGNFGGTVSNDGRYVSFTTSVQANAVNTNGAATTDTNDGYDVYLKDLQTGKLTLVSHTDGDSQTAEGQYDTNYGISGDGRYVFFSSYRDGGNNNLYRWDSTNGSIVQVTIGSHADSFGAVSNIGISDDGNIVSFTNNVGQTWAVNVATGTDIAVWPAGGDATLSGNGQFAAYTYVGQAYWMDLTTGQYGLASGDSNGDPSNGSASWVSISENGRYVAFVSTADNLVAGDNNGTQDVFVRDLNTNTTTRVEIDLDDSSLYSSGFTYQGRPAVDDNGHVYFMAADNALVPGDTNGHLDIYSSNVTTPVGGTVTEDASLVTSTGPNLIQNPGFEGISQFYTLEDWTSGLARAVQVTSGHTGGAGANFYGNETTLSQQFATVIGQTYLVSFYANGIGDSIKVTAGSVVQNYQTPIVSPPDWAQYTFTFTAIDVFTTLAFDVKNTVLGVNDLTLDDISVKQSVSVPNPGTEATSGSFSFTDADAADTHSVSVLANSNIGTFSAWRDADSTNGQTGSVNWTYSVSDSAIEHLAAGEVLSQQYVVRITDSGNPNAFVDQVVTVNAVGVNDAPVLDNSAGAILIDTVAATPLSPPVNVVQNGNFDSGLGSWQPSSGVAVSTTAHSGGTAISGVNGSSVTQNVTTVAGAYYKIDFWVTANNTRNSGELDVSWDGINYSAVTGLVQSVGYREYSFIAQADVFSSSTELFFSFFNSRAGSLVLLDDVTVTQVSGFSGPAPSGQVGTLVSSLVGANNVTDVDDNAHAGIAVTGFSGVSGTWYYSTDNGANWFVFGGVDNSNALLLAADSSTRVYFSPDQGAAGAANITFNAWDGSVGSNGGNADATLTGGSTAFSTEQTTAYVGVVSPSPFNLTAGADSVYYADGTNTVNGVIGAGATLTTDDSIVGGGNDTLNISGNNGSVDLSVAAAFSGFKTINLNGNNDTITVAGGLNGQVVQDVTVNNNGIGNTIGAAAAELSHLTINGGANALAVTDDGTVDDSAFAHMSGINTIMATGANGADITVGANASAMAGGGTLKIDGSGAGNSSFFDISALTVNFVIKGASFNFNNFVMTAAQFASGTTQGGGLSGGDAVTFVGQANIADADFAHETDIDFLNLDDATNSVTLGSVASGKISGEFSIDGSSATAGHNLTVTVGSGLAITKSLDIFGGKGDDLIKMSTAYFDGSTFGGSGQIDGDDGFDTLQFTNAGFINDSGFNNVFHIERLLLADGGDNTVTLGSNSENDMFDTTLIVDGTAMTGANILTVDATALNGNYSFDLRGGTGNDLFKLGSSGFSADNAAISGGGGSNTIQLSDTTSFTVDDDAFTHVTGVQTLKFSAPVGSQFITLGSFFDAAVGPGGTFTVDASGNTGQMTLNASTVATNLIVNAGVNATGFDTINLGTGNDVVNYVASGTNGGADRITDQGGNDTVNITGTSANDTVVIDATGGTIAGINGGQISGSIEHFTINLGANTVAGDTLSYANTLASTSIVATIGGTATGFDGTIAGVENLIGGAGNDTLTGDDNANTLRGGLGVDTINGMGGDDTIQWAIGDGNDVVDGGTGINTLQVVGTDDNDTFTVSLSGGSAVINNGPTLTNVQKLSLDLGAGTSDTLSYAGTADPVTADLSGGTATGFSAGIFNIENVTGGDGNDILSGSTGANIINGGGGDDLINYVVGTSGGGADVIDGGSNSVVGDTVTVLGGTTNDTVTVAVSGGVITGFGGGSVVNVEQFTIDMGSGTDTLSYTGTGAAQSITATIGGTATGFTGNIVGVENLTGGAGNDTLTGDTNNNTLTGGAGADTLTGGGGADTFVITGSDSSPTIIGSAISGYDVIKDFSVADDKLNLPGTAATATISSTNDSTLTVAISGQTIKSHSLSNGIIRFDDAGTFSAAVTLSSNSDVAAAYQYLTRNDIGSAGATLAFAATIGGISHMFVYEQGGSSNTNGTNTLVDLENLSISNLNTSIGNGKPIDPIVLDISGQGIHFTSAHDGVSFDLDASGTPDQVAWTTGQEGILALDVNHNGIIDNGSEIFSPFFAGGSYADGLSALATLDSNNDGKIDASDASFKDLQVWQDTNHNGISDSGELSGLSDLGIQSISLDAGQGGDGIDGQTIAANGTFTKADGTTGNFVEVALDTVPAVTPPASPPAAAPPADSFDFTNLATSLVNNVATIDNFTSGVNTIHIGHDLAGLTIGLSAAGTGDLAHDITAVLNGSNLVANGAAEVTINGGSNAGTYAVVNDGTAGFDAMHDAIIKLANGAVLHTGDFVV